MFCLFLVVVQVFSCTSADCMGVWSHVIYLTRVNSKGSFSPLSPYYKRCKLIQPLFVLYERKVYWFSFKIKCTQYGLLETHHSPSKHVLLHTSGQWRGFLDAAFGVTMLSHGGTRRRYKKRHHHSGTEERSAMHTSDVAGHVDSLCLFLNALNTVWKRHPLSIGDIGLCCVLAYAWFND